MRVFRGGKHRSKTLTLLAFGSFYRRIRPRRTRRDWLSRDASVVDAMNADEMSAFLFTLSGYIDLFTMVGRIQRRRWAYSLPKDLPVLIFSGADDPVGGYGKGVKAVYAKLKGAGLADVKLLLYPGGRHEMLNEINRMEVYEDIRQWLSHIRMRGAKNN